MSFARASAYGRRIADETLVRRSFWGKLRRVAGVIPFIPDLLAAYYCAVDRRTPHHVRLALFAALAYFIAPLDGVPDILPMLGFADDAAMLAAALRLVAGHITPEHQRKAHDALLRVMAVMRRR